MATNTKEKLNIILENIKSQLGGVDLSSKIEDVGYVIEAGDGVARVFGLKNVMMSEMVEFGTTGIYGLALNLEEDSIGVVVLGSYE
jgi:F-type H+-transporting ATPase subunit alpha